MFVVFEGIDGGGKTTVSNQVTERLRARGLAVTHVRENGKFASAVSESIRELGRDAKNLDLTAEAEFLLYVARDVQLIEQALRPALRASDVVLADRFLYTAEVLGRNGRHLAEEWTTPILKAAANGLEPDLVVLVDVDPALARARRKSAKLAANDTRPPARKGLSGVGLQHRLRRGYLECAARSPDRWVVLGNDDDALESLVARVTDLIDEAQRSSVSEALASFYRRAPSPRAEAASPPRTTADALDAFLGWIDRRSEREPRVAAYLLAGIWGAGIDERRRSLAARVPEAILAGATSLVDDCTWELRQSLAATHPGPVARTLTGIAESDARAASWRQALESSAPSEVAESLFGLDGEAAWEARERLFSRAAAAVTGSLAGLGDERAWSLRERWLEVHREGLATSHDLSRLASRSVGGLDDERAWTLRGKAFAAAPVAALASLEGLRGPRSWELRERYLLRAPKVIMATLYGMTDARAWEMRRAVVRDCKEALDSITWLDDAEAWDLRDEHLDSWPSTVVKTLGPLAYHDRGRAMIERQLRSHPESLSLLKHAAAVGAGIWRGAATRPNEGSEL